MAENRTTISNFKARLEGGGARPNLFEVSIPAFPTPIKTIWGDDDQRDFGFLCKATSLPAQNVAAIDVPFRGRTFKVAGDRTIDNWSITVINDEDFNLRAAFEQWSELMAKLDNNMGATDPGEYMVDATVKQLGRGQTKKSDTNTGTNHAVLREYQFVQIFPITVGDIALSYDTGDTIEEFDVEFAVQSLRLSKPAFSPIQSSSNAPPTSP